MFENTGAGWLTALYIVRDCTFSGGSLSILRGYGDVTAPNTFVNGGLLAITREDELQPFYLDRAAVDGSSVAALRLESGDYWSARTPFCRTVFTRSSCGRRAAGQCHPTTGNITT